MKAHVSLRTLGLLCLGLFLFPISVLAQEKATIVGTVTDPTAAVMPGVTITVTNTATGVTRSLQTNAAGNYIAPELVPGSYEVRAESSGFKTYSRTGIVLNVRDTVRVDVAMTVGAVTETVTVSEAVVKVQTESGEVSDLISGPQITQLAMNSRNFFALATLTTGVAHDLPDFNLPIPVGSASGIRFNGLRNEHNIWMIDGGENYDRGCGGCVTVMPSMDALAEFKVMTSNYGADFGIGSAGTVNMTLKSGTRDFHGTLYEYLRNDAVDSVNYFVNAVPRKADGTRAAKTPVMRYNNFGWNLGGPFYIPGKYNTAKNKTFFFFNQEWRKIRQGVTRTANAVPQELRDGDFSNYKDSAGNLITMYVPNTTDPAMLAKYAAAGVVPGAAFPGNVIPASLIDANAAAFLATGGMPLPNLGSLYVGSRMVPIEVREEIIRVDQVVSDKLSIMAHFINDAVVQETDVTLWTGMSYPTVGTIFRNPGKKGVLRFTYVISPTLLNEFAYNYNGNRIDLIPTGIYAKPSGMTIQEYFAGNSENRMPVVALAKQIGATYDTGSWPWHNAADSQQVRDDVSWMVGSHALKFGGQFMRYRKNQDIFGTTQGNYNFNGRFTAGPAALCAAAIPALPCGSDVADFLLGFANTYSEMAIQDRGHWRTSTFSFYFTDSWRATKRLTLNLGVRWEVMPHAYEILNRMSNFRPDLYDPADAAIFLADRSLDTTGPGFTTVPGVPLSDIPFYMNGVRIAGDGIPRGMVDDHYDTVAPRVGFAYDLTGKGKTVFRGGLGVFYERIQGNDVYNTGPNAPFSFNPSVSLVYFSDPSVSVLDGARAAVPIFPASYTALAKEYLPPLSQQWSLGLQHELMPRTVLSVGYVGNQNTHQRIQRNINQPLTENLAGRAAVRAGTLGVDQIRPYLGFSSITYGENSTSGGYHSLQVNLRMDNYRGLTLQSAYTWAHAIDLAAGDFSNAFNAHDLGFNRGNADLDLRHVLTLNYIYELPIFKGHSNAFVRQALGGWQLSGITTFQTGPWSTATYPGDIAGVGIGSVRPILVGDPNTGAKTLDQWFNPAAFAPPDELTFGTAGRNIIERPGRNNWNISIFKVFSFSALTEGAQLQFRAEMFNAFNHTQFAGVDTNFLSANFGKVTSTYDARRIQFGLRFSF